MYESCKSNSLPDFLIWQFLNACLDVTRCSSAQVILHDQYQNEIIKKESHCESENYDHLYQECTLTHLKSFLKMG